jgi:hypothetical protein
MSTVKHQPRKPQTEPYKLLTTTFPLAFLRELDQAAKETGMHKNDILVQAFTKWNTARKKAH